MTRTERFPDVKPHKALFHPTRVAVWLISTSPHVAGHIDSTVTAPNYVQTKQHGASGGHGGSRFTGSPPLHVQRQRSRAHPLNRLQNLRHGSGGAGHDQVQPGSVHVQLPANLMLPPMPATCLLVLWYCPAVLYSDASAVKPGVCMG